MKRNESFSCNKCENVVEVQSVGGGILSCCGEDMHSNISWLFMVTNESAILKSKGDYDGKTIGSHFVIDIKSNITAFSDRPNRQAKKIAGGLNSFAKFYEKSNFMTNPPNVTFAGVYTETEKENSTVFEMEMPFIYQNRFIIPVKNIIGNQVLPPYGNYADVNFVVDNFFGSISHMASSVAGKIAGTAVSGANVIAGTAVSGANAITGTAVSGANVIAGTAVSGANAIAGTAVSGANVIAGTATHIEKHVVGFVSSTYEDAVSDVEKGVKEVEHVAKEIEKDIENAVHQEIENMANDAFGTYKDIMSSINSIMKELEIESISKALVERDIEELAKICADVIIEGAEEFLSIISGDTDVFYVFGIAGAVSIGIEGSSLSTGVGINVTQIVEDIHSVINGNINKQEFTKQIIDGKLLEFFIAESVSIGAEAGETFGVTGGLSFGSTLDSKTIDIALNVSLVEGAGLSVSISIPNDISDIFNINAYSLGAITFSYDVGIDLKVAIGGTNTQSICIEDFIGSKERKTILINNRLINNRWKSEQYINIQEGTITSGEIQSDWWSAQWILEPIGDYFKLKNRWKPTQYINIQDGTITSGEIQSDWWSAQWKIEPIGDYFKLKNRWKPEQYINIQDGTIASGEIQSDWWSAQWKFK